MINRVTLMGKLCDNPELKKTAEEDLKTLHSVMEIKEDKK